MIPLFLSWKSADTDINPLLKQLPDDRICDPCLKQYCAMLRLYYVAFRVQSTSSLMLAYENVRYKAVSMSIFTSETIPIF